MGHPHTSHTHDLQLKNHQKPYTCDGCKQLGFGSRYRCEECDYDLHKDCMFPAPSSSHNFFAKSQFKFLKEPPRACHDWCNRYCDACGKAVHGFVYHCEDGDWDLHPCCRNLNRSYFIDGVEFNLHKKGGWKCIWCSKKNVKGWSYVSECGKFHFHVGCVSEMMLEEWNKCKKRVGDEGLVLERVDLKEIEARGKRHGGRGNKYWRVVKVFFKTIACILLGDPTITLATLLVELLA